MNVEAAAPIKGARAEEGQGSAAGNVGELEHDVAPEKCGVACAFSKPTEQKKSHWTVPAPALLSPPNATEHQSPQQSSPSPGEPGEEMLWGGRRDFLPRSQEVKRRDGNPNTRSFARSVGNGGS